MTGDGRWVYRWDGENRLIEMETDTNKVQAAGVPHQKLLFGYDHQSRRISKVVSNWTGATWTCATDLRFAYDGWNLLAEVGTTGSVVRSYAWGLDLSGTEQGAGGIGGLLWMTSHQSPVTSHFYAFDGNGNVAALLNAQTAQTSAEYEYGPFGETIRATGPSASENVFRFSAKYTDSETGLLYFGYRYYQPSTGRWPSRDPIAEFPEGQTVVLALYAMLRNTPVNDVDPFGLVDYTNQPKLDSAGNQITGYPLGFSIAFKAYQAKTNPGGHDLTAWKPDVGNTYWCHGYTFGGWNAPNGPFSISGGQVNTVLNDEGWKKDCCGMVGAGGIVIFYQTGGISHSGIIDTVVINNAQFDENASKFTSKIALNANALQGSFGAYAGFYGKYSCFTKTPKVGCCPKRGANEIE